jgi:hypothetical protein
VVYDSLSPASPLGDAVDVFIRREDADRFVEEIRADHPDPPKFELMVTLRRRGT